MIRTRVVARVGAASLALAVFAAALVAAAEAPARAAAAPTSVSGRACGYYLKAKLGASNPYEVRGCGQDPALAEERFPPPSTSTSYSVAYSPAVVTPPAGGTRTASNDGSIGDIDVAMLFRGQYPNATNDPGELQFAPRSGPIDVSTQSTVGANPSVTSTATISPGTQGVADPNQPRGVGPSTVVADALSSTCTADGSALTGSSAYTNGLVVTSTYVTGEMPGKFAGDPKTTVPIAASPAPNISIDGVITNVGDRFRVVVNEQIVGPTSITVNAAHVYLLGPIVVGDLIIGQSVCSLVGHTPTDLTGDGRTDFSVFRPGDGTWWVSDGTNAFWGAPGDIPVPGDYNGDGATDYAVFRPSTGAWYVLGGTSAFWGTADDVPVPADYNGDGTTDIAVYRPSTGAWYVLGGSNAFWGTPGAGDVPVPGDYDADGKADLAVYRPSNGGWYFKVGLPADQTWTNVVWGGLTGDVPVPGDYNGDSQTDVAVYRPSTGGWYVYGGDNALWGIPGDVPQPADYNGDGITDFATYNPGSGLWAVAGGAAKLWGQPGDVPLALPYAIRSVFYPVP